MLLRHIVDGEEIFGKGNHQTAGSFHQHPVVAAGQFEGSPFNLVEIDGTSVDAGGQVRRARIRENLGHGQPFPVLAGNPYP